MKGLLIAAVVILILGLAGWLSFSSNDSAATITIDKQQIKEDTHGAVEKLEDATEKAVDTTRDVLHRAEQKVDELDDSGPASNP
ncbi:MAG: hypothetical protein KF861_09690 [Planctomycetaceae bacterium]|nr:hypothetical protein [Planctomycetaceae bacterium]